MRSAGSRFFVTSGVSGVSLLAAALASFAVAVSMTSCVCGEDGRIIGPGGGEGNGAGAGSGGGDADRLGGGGGGGGDPGPVLFDAGAGAGPSDAGDAGTGGAGGTGGGVGGPMGGGGGRGGGAPDAGAGQPDAGTGPPGDLCDLSGDGDCPCLHLAVLGFRGKDYSSDVFADWLGALAPGGVSSLGGATLTPQLLATYQVLVVEDVRHGTPGQAGVGAGIGRGFSSEEVDALAQWLTQGGGLVTLIGYSDASELTNVNQLLAPLGLMYGATDGSWDPVTHWAEHPISNGVKRVPFRVGYGVGGAGMAIAWEPNPGQYDIGRAAEVGRGRVFAWGDEWIAYKDSLSQSDAQVARLWTNVLQWLVPPSQCQFLAP